MLNSLSVRLLAAMGMLLPPSYSAAQNAPPTGPTADNASHDWLTWGYDQERSGWNRGETALTKQNVGKLKLKWSTQLSTPVRDVVMSTLTAPLIVEGVMTAAGPQNLVFTLGSDDTVFAVNADTGKPVWQKSVPNTAAPRTEAVWECPNTANATPVIDKRKGVIYFLASDGKLRGLSLADGSERLAPTDFEPAFSRSWSLNLIDDVVYTTAARGCGGAKGEGITAGNVAAIDVSDPQHPHLTKFFTGPAKPAGPWGRGGVVRGPKGVYTQTADGQNDLGGGVFGESVIALAPKLTALRDSYIPSNWRELNAHDLDLGSAGPVAFPFGNRTLIATGAKDAVVYLLNAENLGGGPPDHSHPLYQTPKLANPDQVYAGHGIWGGFATYENSQGQRFVYVPIWGQPAPTAPQFPNSYGEAPHGSVMAFQVVNDAKGFSLQPAWMSKDLYIPDVPVIANGVVFTMQTGEQTTQNPNGKGAKPENDILSRFRSTPISHQILYAFDAETGKQLFSSGDTLKNWGHFGEPAIALGKIFAVSHDGHLFAFGLPH